MPRNFDEERAAQDLDFVIRGQKFSIQYVRPEVIAAFEDEEIPDKAVDAVAWTAEHIKLFLNDANGATDRWDKVRGQEQNPVSLGEMNELLQWMIRVNSGLPTEPSAPSAPGRGRTAASSKGA